MTCGRARQRTAAALVLAALAGSAALAGCSAAQQAEVTARCADAAEQARVGRLADASRAYAQAQRAGDGACADQGLAAVTRRRADADAVAAQAEAAERDGDVEAARERYATALALDAGNAEALAGRSRVTQRPATVGPLWLTAQRLHDEGYDDEARAEIARVLRENPDAVVPVPLANLSPALPPPGPAGADIDTLRSVNPLVALLWVVALLALVLLGAVAVLARSSRSLRRAVAARAGGLGRRLAVDVVWPGTDARALDRPLGPAFTARTLEWLRGVVDPELRVLLDTVMVDAAALGSRDLPRRADPPGEGRGVRALGRAVLPRDTLVLGATLHPTTVKGGGVALVLATGDGRTLHEGTVWNRAPVADESRACELLAPRAAAWILDVLAHELPWTPGVPLRSGEGAGQWERYAAFLAGLEAAGRGAPAEAATWWRTARGLDLVLDPQHPDIAAATLAEALAHVATAAPQVRDHAVAELDQLLDVPHDGSARASSRRHRARLHRAVALVDAAAWARAAGASSALQEAQRAVTAARELAVDLLAEHDAPHQQSGGALPEDSAVERADLVLVRQRLRAPAVLLLARALAAAQMPYAVHPLAPRQVPGVGPGQLRTTEAEDADQRLLELIRQTQGASLNRPLPDLMVRRVVDCFVLDPFARYQLTAYLVQTGAVGAAAEHLEAAVSSPFLAARALSDPAWQRARDDVTLGPRLRRLADGWLGAPPPIATIDLTVFDPPTAAAAPDEEARTPPGAAG